MSKLNLPVLVVLVFAGLSGCGQPSPGPTTPPQSPPSVGTSPRADNPMLDKDGQPSSGQSNGEAAAPSESTAKVDPETKPEAPKQSDQTAPEETVSALLTKANAAGRAQDFAEGVRILEEVLRREPVNQAGLSMMARMTQRQGWALLQTGREDDSLPLFRKSAQVMRQLRDLNPALSPQDQQMLPIILYNEACVYCRDMPPDLDKAVAALKDAVDAGFNSLEKIDSDSDLDPIRDRDDFKEIRARLEAKQ